MRSARIGSLVLLASLAVAAPLRGQGSGFVTLSQTYLWTWAQGGAPGYGGTLCSATHVLAGDCGVAGASVDGYASATGGALRVRSHLTLSGTAPTGTLTPGTTNWGYTLTSYALLRDRLTFTGILPASVRVSYTLDGVRTATSVTGTTNLAPGGRVYFGAVQSTTGLPPLHELYVNRDDGAGSRVVPVAYGGFVDVPVVGGTPLSLALELLSTATINTGSPGALLGGIVDADFSHTLTWGVRAYDASGGDVTAQAGLVLASAVPEPGTVVLVMTGVGLLALRRRGQRDGGEGSPDGSVGSRAGRRRAAAA